MALASYFQTCSPALALPSPHPVLRVRLSPSRLAVLRGALLPAFPILLRRRLLELRRTKFVVVVHADGEKRDDVSEVVEEGHGVAEQVLRGEDEHPVLDHARDVHGQR